MRFPINMTTKELDNCPACKHLIYKTEGAWLNIWLSGHASYADSNTPHEHQPPKGENGEQK